jgi:hypothetical protein
MIVFDEECQVGFVSKIVPTRFTLVVIFLTFALVLISAAGCCERAIAVSAPSAPMLRCLALLNNNNFRLQHCRVHLQIVIQFHPCAKNKIKNYHN